MVWLFDVSPSTAQHRSANSDERAWSGVRLMVNVAAVIDVEDVDDAGGFIDAVHDPVGATPGAVTSDQRTEQRLADTLRIHRECRIAEFQDCGGDGLGQPLGDGPPGGRLASLRCRCAIPRRPLPTTESRTCARDVGSSIGFKKRTAVG